MAIANTLVTHIDSVKYSDANLNIQVGESEELVRDVESINNSILTILSTPKFTRVFNRNFGSNINALLFEPMDNITAGRIKSEVIEAIKLWEYRLIVRYAQVLPDYDNQQYYVEIEYIVPSLNDKNVTLKFNLMKG